MRPMGWPGGARRNGTGALLPHGAKGFAPEGSGSERKSNVKEEG